MGAKKLLNICGSETLYLYLMQVSDFCVALLSDVKF